MAMDKARPFSPELKKLLAVGAITTILTAGLVFLSVYQNFCANNAEVEVARVVIRMTNAGVETQSEVPLPNDSKITFFSNSLKL